MFSVLYVGILCTLTEKLERRGPTTTTNHHQREQGNKRPNEEEEEQREVEDGTGKNERARPPTWSR